METAFVEVMWRRHDLVVWQVGVGIINSVQGARQGAARHATLRGYHD